MDSYFSFGAAQAITGMSTEKMTFRATLFRIAPPNLDSQLVGPNLRRGLPGPGLDEKEPRPGYATAGPHSCAGRRRRQWYINPGWACGPTELFGPFRLLEPAGRSPTRRRIECRFL